MAAGQIVEVTVTPGDPIEILQPGKLLRTHVARHDRSKEHSTFVTPAGQPCKHRDAERTDAEAVAEVPKPICSAGGET